MRRLLLSTAAVVLGLAIAGNADAKGSGHRGSKGGSKMGQRHDHHRRHRDRRYRRYWSNDYGCYCYYYPEWGCYAYWDASCDEYRPIALNTASVPPAASPAQAATVTAVATATAGARPSFPPGANGPDEP